MSDHTTSQDAESTSGDPETLAVDDTESAAQRESLSLGDTAPEFTAESTQGPVNFPSDYRGKWVILFSHPADFTPVCTSEFMTFAVMEDEFRKYNTELVGVSVDGLYSHIAWLRTIRDLYYENRDVLAQLPTEEERVDRMCELNVIQQVANVGHTSIVQNAWHRGQNLSIHGCIYGIKDGRWKSLNTTISGFEQLPPQYRLVLTLRYFQDLSYIEIAEVLDEPVSTVRMRLFRGRNLLCKIVEQARNAQQRPTPLTRQLQIA